MEDRLSPSLLLEFTDLDPDTYLAIRRTSRPPQGRQTGRPTSRIEGRLP